MAGMMNPIQSLTRHFRSLDSASAEERPWFSSNPTAPTAQSCKRTPQRRTRHTPNLPGSHVGDLRVPQLTRSQSRQIALGQVEASIDVPSLGCCNWSLPFSLSLHASKSHDPRSLLTSNAITQRLRACHILRPRRPHRSGHVSGEQSRQAPISHPRRRRRASFSIMVAT